MNRRFRLDYGKLGEVTRTPQGGLVVPAALTRSGVFDYHDDGGNLIREWRPREEVFKADALATLKAAPLTVDHPPEQIKPSNFRQFSLGHVGDDVRQDNDKTVATTYWQDAAAVRAIENGRREVSCGYHCDVDEAPGVVPAGEPDAGEHYDRIQRSIKYNHVALVNTGRAGSDVRLRLDSAGDQLTGNGEPSMADKKIEVLDGVEYEAGTDAHRAARERKDAADKTIAEQIKQLMAERDEAVKAQATEKARADAADKKLVKVIAGAKEMLTPERFDKAVKSRAELVARATEVLGKEFKTDGLRSKVIKIAIVNKQFGVRLDEADPKCARELPGMWRAAKALKVQGQGQRRDDTGERKAIPDHLRTPPAGHPTANDGKGGRTLAEVRADSIGSQDDRSSAPLAFSKQGGRGQATPFPAHQSAQLETMK